MADANVAEGTIINGYEPVTVLDVECVSNIVEGYSEAMVALFRTIARLTDDREIVALCGHGALQGELAANDVDFLRERVLAAGFDAKGVHHVLCK